jgi:hypothetical protein
MKKLYIFLSCSVFTISVYAQTVPILPKEWKGEISATSMGVAHKTATPNQAATGWNSYDEARTLTVLRQEGRHLEFVLKNPRGEIKWVGTLSKDGKQIAMASPSSNFIFALSGNSLSGCGTTRGANGTFDDWFGKYAALCFDFTAVK